MRFLRIAICITAIVLPLGVHAQVGPCSSTNTCAAGQECVGPEGSRLCYRTCNPAAVSGATDACPAGEACSRPTGFTQDVCQLSAPADSSASTEETDTETETPFVPITPQLGVSIPGGALSAPTREGGVVRVAFLAEYINAAYRYLASIALIVAIVMCVYGGFLYLGGSAGIGQISRGKKIITDAIVGMLLILASFGILNIINPDTTNLKVLQLAFVNTVVHDYEMEDFDMSFATPEQITALSSGEGISVDSSSWRRISTPCVHTTTPVDPSLIEPLRRAGERFCELRGSNTNWRQIRGGGSRSPQEQVRLWLKRCLNRVNCIADTGPGLPSTLVGRDSANRKIITNASIQALAPRDIPDPRRAYTDQQIEPILNALRPHAIITDRSAHGQGLGVDVYCYGATESHMDAPVACQLVLEQAMKEAGFCRLTNEWWHFELASNPITSSCQSNWNIGEVRIRVGDASAATTFNYRNCRGRFNSFRAQRGEEPCRPE